MEKELVLDMDWNITKAQAKAQKLQREFEISKQKAANIKEEMQRMADNIEQSKQKQKQLTAELEQSSNRLDAYYQNQLQLSDKQVQNEIKKNAELQKQIDKEEIYQAQQTRTIAKQEISLNRQNANTAAIGNNIAISTRKTSKFKQALENSGKSANKLGKRIGGLVTRVFMFSVITKALRSLREQFGKMITEQGTKTAELAAKLKGGLSVISTTLYESAKPAIEWILNALVKMVNILATGLAKILGKDINEMKKLASATKKTGEEAKKATAGFDTLQTINTSSNSSSSSDDSSLKMDTSAIGGELDGQLVALMAIVSGALLVIGCILAFTGVNIPLGIRLMIEGAALLATAVVPNWDTLSPELKNTLAVLLTIISTGLLVIGCILAFSGVNIPLGIALIALGAAGLVAVAKVMWGSLDEKTRNTITGIMGIGGALLMVLGIVLLFTGAGIPLGIGLIAAGAGMIYGALKLTPGDTFLEKVKNLAKNCKDVVKNAISWLRENLLDKLFGTAFGESLEGMFDSVCDVFHNIIEFFTGVFTGDWKKAGAALVNIIISALNFFINKVNAFIGFFAGGGAKLINKLGKLLGKDWGLSADGLKIPTIPKYVPALATGAVLPGGSPMLAWVNDQPKGQGYIEGSVENIAAAFEKYLGDRNLGGSQNLTIEAKGNWAQFIKWMNLQIKQENKRSTAWG